LTSSAGLAAGIKRYRFVLAIAVTVLAMGVLAILSIYRVSNLNAKIYNEDFLSAQKIARIGDLTNSYRLKIYHQVASLEIQPDLLLELAYLDKQIETELGGADTLFLTPEEKTRFTQVVRLWGELRTSYRAILELSLNYAKEEALDAMSTKNQELYRQAQKAISDLILLKSDAVRQSYESGRRIAMLTQIGTGFTLALCAAACLFFVRKNNLTLLNANRALEKASADLKSLASSLEQRVQERTADAKAASRRLVDMTDALPLAVFQVRTAKNGKPTYSFVGANAREILGVDAQDIMANPEARFGTTMPEDRAMIEAEVASAIAQRRSAAFHHRIVVDGEVRWVYAHTVTRLVGDEVVWNGFWMDHTEARALEEQLRQAKDQAEEAVRAKSLFLANMSHEIRTPMNAIIGLAYLALKTPLTRQQRDYIDKVHRAGSSLLGVLNDILDFSKIEAGKIDLDPVEFGLARALDNTMAVIGYSAADKGLELIVDIGADVPDALLGDPLRLEQILINLIGNAVKFTTHGEIVVQVELLQTVGERVELRFSVRDSGIGLTADQSARLFNAFSQADESTTRKYGGTGLGLTICRRLVELMGGQIAVDSATGVGSTFSFNVWLEQGAGDGEALTPLPASICDMTVLVVDDNPRARAVLAAHCERLGCTVEQADDGAQAVTMVALAASGGAPFSLVLIDCAMPAMGGADVARAIRADPNVLPQPKLVLLTALREDDMRPAMDDLVIDAFIAKPVSALALHETFAAMYCAARLPALHSAAQHSHLAGMRVLLAEDNRINQQIASELMGEAGIVVDIADNGSIAVTKVFNGGDYDVVLMDVQMPEMDGYTATAAIRSDPRFARLPILAMTAHAMVEARARCFAVGMNDHVAKPIDPDALLATLARWTGRSPASAAPGGVRIEAPVPPAADAPWLDEEAGARRMGGKLALYRRIAVQFARTYVDGATQIAAHLAAGERLPAEHAAHAIRGAAANVGASPLAYLAGELEDAIHAGTEDAQLLERFTHAMNASLEAIGRMQERALTE
jgi:two-component system sensor histidine kinase/response regulator